MTRPRSIIATLILGLLLSCSVLLIDIKTEVVPTPEPRSTMPEMQKVKPDVGGERIVVSEKDKRII